MKKKLFLLIMICAIPAFLKMVQAQNDFRYYVKGKFPKVVPEFSTLFVSLKPGLESSFLKNAGKNEILRDLEFISYTPVNAYLIKSRTGKALDRTISLALQEMPEVLASYPAMEYEGQTILFQHKILAMPKAGQETRSAEFLRSKGEIKSEINLGKERFFEFNPSRSSDVFAVSRTIYESGLFDIAEPSIVFSAQNIGFIPNDPDRNSQWFLDQTSDADIDAFDAYSVTQGSSAITIAVIDGNGYDITHPDLAGKLVTPYDAVNNDNDPSPENADANHGTPCAGLVGAATNNSVGVAGVGFNTKVLPIVIGFNAAGLGFSTSTTVIANAAAKVVATPNCVGTSNSWSSSSASFGAAFEASYISMRNNTRGGLGAVNLCAYGNSNTLNGDVFPANFGTSFTVCASNITDNRASFSNYGINAKITAPGENGIYTIDRSGASGYSTGDYTNFSGTSAATPVVGGVLGLIGAVNSGLTATIYEEILARSADKAGPYTYAVTSGYSYGTWNQEMGYGRVNALKAVLLTGSCSQLPSSTCGTAFINNFTLGTINNAASGCSGGGYSLLTAPAQTTSIKYGTTTSFTITGNTSLFYGVWIDLNGDGDFADASEFVFSNPTAAGTISNQIVLADNIGLLGEKRLRIRCRTGSAFSATQSCDAVSTGETEDYMVKIIEQYCIPVALNNCISSGDFIDGVNFAGISNVGTGCNGSFTFNSSLPPFLCNIGGSYPISLLAGPQYEQNFGVWIDYNNDKDFEDAGEFVFSGLGAAGINLNGNITIANNSAFIGTRRIRIRSSYSPALTAADFCSTVNYGETEDYLIQIGPVFSRGTLTSGNQALCNPADPAAIAFSTAPVGALSFSYQWYFQSGIVAAPTGSSLTGWTAITGATSSSYDPPSGLTTNRTYACFVTPQGNIAGWASGARQITVRAVLNYGTIAAGNQSFTGSGDPTAISLSTAASGGSGTFAYQWYSATGIVAQPTGTTIPAGWSAITGATAASYDPPVISASTSYALRVDPTGTPDCGAATWASGVRQITIATVFSPGTLASGNQALCTPGNPALVSFSAAASTGSSFQWYYQDGIIAAPANTAALTGWTSITGATAASFDPPAGLTLNRTYACRVANGANSQWASGVRQITINPISMGAIISEPYARCGSGPITFYGMSDFPGSDSYQWYSAETGGILLGSGSPVTINISEGTGAVWMSVTTSAGCTNPQRYPQAVSIASLTDFGILSAGNQSLIAPADPSPANFSSLPPSNLNPSSVGYQWYYKDGIAAQPTGSSTTGWIMISGTTENTYDPPSGLTASRTYACLVNRLICGDIGWASGVKQVTVSPFSPGTLASGNQTLCNPADPAAITFSTAATTGSSFQWYFQNGIIAAPANTAALTGWTSITGATAASFDPPSGLTASRTFACRVTNGTNSQWASSVRQITVRAVLNFGTIAAGNQSFTGSGNPALISLSTAASGGSGTFAYQWYSSPGIVAQPSGTTIPVGWTAITGATTASYDPPVISASTSYALRVDPTGTPDCGAANFASGVRQITISTSSSFSPGTLAAGNQTLCNGGNPAAIAFSTAATTGSAFQWYFQNGIIAAPANTAALTGWTAITGVTAASYDPPTGLTASRTYACRVTNGTNSQWASGVRQVTILPAFSPGTLIASQSGCVGYNPNPITMATNPQGSGAYNWKWFYVENTTVTCPTGSADPAGWTSSTTDTRFFGTSTTGTGILFDPTSAGAAGRTWVLKITPAANGTSPACGAASLTNCHRTSLLACRLAENEQSEDLSSGFFLGNAQPNPWEDKTDIQVQLPAGKESGKITIRSLEGKIVHTQIVSGEGRQSVTLSRGNWPAGVYFYSLEAGNELQATRKMVLIR